MILLVVLTSGNQKKITPTNTILTKEEESKNGFGNQDLLNTDNQSNNNSSGSLDEINGSVNTSSIILPGGIFLDEEIKNNTEI